MSQKQEPCKYCQPSPMQLNSLLECKKYLIDDLVGIVKEYLMPTLTIAKFNNSYIERKSEKIDEYETKFGKIHIKTVVSKLPYNDCIEKTVKFQSKEESKDTDIDEYHKFDSLNINCDFSVENPEKENEYMLTFVKTYYDGSKEEIVIQASEENNISLFQNVDFVYNTEYIVFITNNSYEPVKVYYYNMKLGKITNYSEFRARSAYLAYSFNIDDDYNTTTNHKINKKKENDAFHIVTEDCIETLSFDGELLQTFEMYSIICEYLREREKTDYCIKYNVILTYCQDYNLLVYYRYPTEDDYWELYLKINDV